MGLPEWTLLLGLIALAVSTVGVISTILTVTKTPTRVVMFAILGIVGILSLGAVIVGAALTFSIVSWPTPTPTPTPTATQTPTPIQLRTPTPGPTATEVPSSTQTPSVSTVPQPSPQVTVDAETVRSRRSEPPKVIDNDVGKSKTNDFYEITIENALSTTDQVWRDGCRVPVPPNQKAVVVRLAIRWLPYKTLTADQAFRMGSVKPTDFLIIDDSNRRIDPVCQNFAIFVNESANTKELVYLVNISAARLRFSFQKAGTGNPISFDLSGLD